MSLTKNWSLLLGALWALGVFSFMMVMMVMVMMVMMVMLRRSAASWTSSVRFVLGTEQIVKNVYDGGDVSLGLSILVLQCGVESTWQSHVNWCSQQIFLYLRTSQSKLPSHGGAWTQWWLLVHCDVSCCVCWIHSHCCCCCWLLSC